MCDLYALNLSIQKQGIEKFFFFNSKANFLGQNIVFTIKLLRTKVRQPLEAHLSYLDTFKNALVIFHLS